MMQHIRLVKLHRPRRGSRRSLIVVVLAFPASATAAVAEALDDADDGDAQEEGHQASKFGHELQSLNRLIFCLCLSRYYPSSHE